MTAIRQASFAAGELAPSLWGRTDLDRYGHGLRGLLNGFVSKQGAAVSRAGTKYLGTASATVVDAPTGYPLANLHHYSVSGVKVRLIPFHFSDTNSRQNYVLEFGQHYVNIWQNDQFFGTVSGTIPYLAADLFKIRVAQSLDVLYIACAGYPPATISRTLDTNNNAVFTYAAMSFVRSPPSNPTLTPALFSPSIGAIDGTHPAKPWNWLVTVITTNSVGALVESAPMKLGRAYAWYGAAWNANIPYQQGTIVSYKGTYYYASADATNFRGTTPDNVSTPFAVPTAWSSTLTYKKGDAVLQAGVLYSSLQNGNLNNPLTNSSFWGLASGMYQLDSYSGSANWLFDSNGEYLVPLSADRPVQLWAWPQGTVGKNVIAYRWYRGRAGYFGWIEDTTDAAFVDQGKDPDFSIAPPQGLNPFEIRDNTGALIRTETAIGVTFFEDRLTFVGTPESRPHFVLASAVGDYSNFDQRLVPRDDDAIIFALASRKREMARAAVGLDRLIVLTDSSLWSVSGSGGAPLAPDSVEAHAHASIGSDWPAPLIVEGGVLWVRDKGTGVRGAHFDLLRGSFQSQDLSMSAEHLMLGHKIVDWCYAEDPWGVAWMVREDGALLSLTYSPESQLWGWGRHYILGPGSGSLAIPAVVQSICTIPQGDEDVVYLALQGAPSPAWSSSTTYASGAVVNYNGADYQSLAASNLNNTPNTATAWWRALESIGGPAWILRMDTRCETLTKQPSPVDSFIEYDNWSVLGGGYTFVGSFTHLIGRPVYVVADGTVFGPYTVDGNGSVTVNFPASKTYSKIAIGLAFNAQVDLLDLPEGRTRQKIVTEVGVEARFAAGSASIQAGPDRATVATQSGFSTDPEVVRIPIQGTWNTGGRATLFQPLPYAFTLLGVTREVDRGEA